MTLGMTAWLSNHEKGEREDRHVDRFGVIEERGNLGLQFIAQPVHASFGRHLGES